ncbi:MAG: TolC family protein [Azoarcus sp.]|jgi:cobalt-zinc-cadmium efflux system outer membrane protein|nr:TolC family protein [Azoarcus sp.]
MLSIHKVLLAAAFSALTVHDAVAQDATPLKQFYDAAWARQPEAQAHALRAEAALAERASADGWLAGPPALELSALSGQGGNGDGRREYGIGVTMPLWLPGERDAAGALAEAGLRANDGRLLAAQLRTAAEVRDAYWDWRRARVELALGRERLAGARALAADVARRVAAGDLARADQHQADGAQAGAEATLAAAESALAASTRQLAALTGAPPADSDDDDDGDDDDGLPAFEADPAARADEEALAAQHPLVQEARARAEIASQAARLAGVQRRANPELGLSTTRERDAAGADWQQTVTIGLRFPLGSDARGRARLAAAWAETAEAEARLRLAQEQVLPAIATARARANAARTQVAAAQRRARLARASRDFFDHAFRLGETDLPTRLRVGLEASDAERELAGARVELGAAISTLRQAMGLLPE